MPKPTIIDLASRINYCIDMGDQLTAANQTNLFFTYLAHLKLAKEQNFDNLNDFYAANTNIDPNLSDTFKDEHALPSDLELTPMGGNYSPVYLAKLTQDGESIQYVFKIDRQDKEEYLKAKETLANNEDVCAAVIGEAPLKIDEGLAETYELCALLEGGDLEQKMRNRDPSKPKDILYKECGDIMTNTMAQLDRLADLDIYMTDIKPGNIFFDTDNNVHFADLKGMIQAEDGREKLENLDRTPGYTPVEMDGVKEAVDLKALSIHQLLVTMESFVRGEKLGERIDKDLVLKQGAYYFNTDPQTPYKPDFSNIDTHSPGGQMLAVVTSELEQIKGSGNIDFKATTDFMQKMNTLCDQRPKFMKQIFDEKSNNPDNFNTMLELIKNDITTPAAMMEFADKKMKDNKPRLRVFKNNEYKKYSKLKNSLEGKVFFTKEESTLQSKLNTYARDLQNFRDIENKIQGPGFAKLSQNAQATLLNQLDNSYARVFESRGKFVTHVDNASKDASEYFKLVDKKTFGDFYFTMIQKRYSAMANKRPNVYKESPLLNTEPTQNEAQHKSATNQDQRKNVRDFINHFEKSSNESTSSKPQDNMTDPSNDEEIKPDQFKRG